MRINVINFAAPASSGRLGGVLEASLAHLNQRAEVTVISSFDDFCKAAGSGSLKDSGLLVAVELDQGGLNLDACRLLSYLHSNAAFAPLSGAWGGVVVDGKGQLFTKDMGRKVVFAANMAGCSFPGKPLVEATSDLFNFSVLSELWGVTCEAAYKKSVYLLIDKVVNAMEGSAAKPAQAAPKVLAIHAGNSKTSNSYCLWSMVAKNLDGKADIQEISIRNGQLVDCRGCKYEDCLHFGENAGCFYGGVMVEKVYPAIIDCDILVLICPNYNDSVSANIMAFINRLTAVFRAHDFSRKRIFAVVVSGYSGGDIVTQQIIGAINMNKNLMLPARFAMIETANRPGDILKIHDIKEKAAKFAADMIKI